MAEPRKTVVVKTPGQRGPLLDIILGVLGAVLLVAAIALIPVLPVKEVIIPQYRLTVRDNPVETGPDASCSPQTQTFAFATGTAADQAFDWAICDDNVYSVTFTVEFKDDVPQSLPDGFMIKLFGPDGADLIGSQYAENAEPPLVYNASAGQPPDYPAQLFQRTYTKTFNLKPEDAIIDAAGPDETPRDAETRLAEEMRIQTKGGFFRTDIHLDHAGPCPAPPNQTDALRTASCGPAQDTGNPFSVTRLQYNFYTLEVASLEE